VSRGPTPAERCSGESRSRGDPDTAPVAAGGGRSRPRNPGDLLAASADGLLGAFVVAVAAWTVSYHVALVFGWSVDVALVLWAAVSAAAGVAAARMPRTGGDDAAPRGVPSSGVAAAALAAVGVAAGAVAGARVLDEPGWYGFWAAGILVSAGGVALVVRGEARAAARSHPVAQVGALAVVTAALLFAALSAGTVRPDADDVFLLNRSSWVEQRGGTFPVRDTLFSDEVFRADRPERPPTSIEPLVGAVARILPVSSPTVAYLGLAPIVSALGVLALWRLLRTLRAPAPALACLAGTGFLALDGAVHTSFGNMSFARAWQGKVVFLFVVVPLLWHWALRWSRDGDRRALAALALGNIAGVGLTTTAMLVAPPVTLLGAVAGLGPERRKRILAALAALAYPIGAGLVAASGGGAVGGALGDLRIAAGRGVAFMAQVGAPAPLGGVGGLDPADPWYASLGRGVPLAIASAAVLLAWLATRDRSARVALALAPGVVLLAFCSPGALHLLDSLTGARSILWRVVWVLPVPAAVGLVLTAPALLPRGVGRTVLLVAFPAAAAALLLAAGTPVWSAQNGASSGRPAWDVPPGDLAAAEHLRSLSSPGDLVMAPEPVGGALAIIDVDVRSVDPRDRYVYDHRKKSFHAPERILLARAAATGAAPEEVPAVDDALSVLGVDAACIRPVLAPGPVGTALEAAGFEIVGSDADCTYYVSTG